MIDNFETTVEKKLNSSNYTGSLANTLDIIQVKLKCCGVKSPINFAKSKFHNNVSTYYLVNLNLLLLINSIYI